jgi:hypothetical protein
MKAIIKGKRVKKEYYLGYDNPFVISFGNYKNELDVYSKSNDKGQIKSIVTDVEEIVLEETAKFTRELNVGEYILLRGVEYKITKVSHDTVGNLIYHVDYEEVIEDKESKIKAEKDLEIRKAVLKCRETEEKLAAEVKLKELTTEIKICDENNCNTKRRRWKFW